MSMPAPTLTPSQSLEITLSCEASQAELLESLLWTLDGLDSVLWDYAVISGEETFKGLRVYGRDPQLPQALESFLNDTTVLETLQGVYIPIQGVKIIEASDWSESWKQHWHAQWISDDLLICPSWEELPPDLPPQAIVLRLDPGCAFGTGTHETTRLMLQTMTRLHQTLDFSLCNILDLGTGSGILAIYAAKLGCRSMMALDIDPLALEATETNSKLNHVADAITASLTPIDALCRTPYEVVLANILGPTLVELMPEIACRMVPGGTLLMSGIISKHLEALHPALAQHGFTLEETFQEGDWYVLQARYTA